MTSAGRSDGLIGVTAAPKRHAANNDTTKLAVLGSMMATTSPADTPWPRSDAAARCTAARNWALSRSVLSSATAGPQWVLRGALIGKCR